MTGIAATRQQIEKYLKDHNFNFNVKDEMNLYYFSVALDSDLKTCHYMLEAREDRITVFCQVQLGEVSQSWENILIFLGLVNTPLVIGGFYLSTERGPVMYRHVALCDSSKDLQTLIHNNIMNPYVTLLSAGNHLLSVTSGAKSVEEAFTAMVGEQEANR